MLARSCRITKDKEFAAIFQHGKAYFSKSFTARCLATNKKNPRLGIVVSKAKIAKAVLRNQSKRRLRAIFREFWPMLAKTHDIVVILGKEIINQNHQNLKQEVENFLKRKKLIP